MVDDGQKVALRRIGRMTLHTELIELTICFFDAFAVEGQKNGVTGGIGMHATTPKKWARD